MIVVIDAENDRRQHCQAEHHQQEPEYPLYDCPVHLDEGHPDLEKTLQVFDFAAVCHKQNDVIIGLNHSVVMSDDDLVTTNHRYDRRAFG